MEKTQLLPGKFNYVSAQDPCTPKNYAVADQFSFTTVECSQVKGIVNSRPSKKAPGIDKVSPRLIRESLPIITPTITFIINASLTSGVFYNFIENRRSVQFLRTEIMKKPVVTDQFHCCQYSQRYAKE